MSRTRARAGSPIGALETLDPVSELTIHLGLCPTHDVRLGQDDEVEGPGPPGPESPEAVPQQAARAVADRRAADACASSYCQAQPERAQVRGGAA